MKFTAVKSAPVTGSIGTLKNNDILGDITESKLEVEASATPHDRRIGAVIAVT